MKAKLRPPSPATLIALLALFVALGGTAYAVDKNIVKSSDIAPNAVRAGDLGPMNVRTGMIRDTDTTAGDGIFNMAIGKANCKRGEQLISGGVRMRGNLSFGSHRVSILSSAPVTRFRQWAVTLNSDLGGGARSRFVAYAYCLAR